MRRDKRQGSDFTVGAIGLGLILAVACLVPWALDRCGISPR